MGETNTQEVKTQEAKIEAKIEAKAEVYASTEELTSPRNPRTKATLIKRLGSFALRRNISLAPLFEHNGERLQELLTVMKVKTKFPGFHKSFEDFEFGGL